MAADNKKLVKQTALYGSNLVISWSYAPGKI